MKVLFSGGGTAGHITPAIAISEMLEKKYKNYETAFVGRKSGDENRAVEELGHKLYTLDVLGLKRSMSPKNIKAVYKLIKSMREAGKIIDDFSPDLIIGTGGYVCYPIIRAGLKRNIPCLLHESNAYPGLVTRMLGHKCDGVMLGMEAAKEHLPRCNNISIVGNPIREKFVTLDKKTARKKLGINGDETFIVSFGGSIGAERMNTVILDFMKEFSVKTTGIKHVHSSGKTHYESIKEKVPELCAGMNGCKILPYIDNMPEMLSAADISITRSGAMTLAELSAVDCYPILIPSPNVTANHQFHNAKAMADKGKAILIEEAELSVSKLTETVCTLMSNKRANTAICISDFSRSGKRCQREIIRIVENTLKIK